ncbi:uncharacterized protein PAC_03558 [Phialocephala subalpina]|uniref:Myb-like DNA-binding domain-containing protein n=1 Tax=Phialocephala subalpina TaxID=576137 RepID=A0A1L7WLN1_9HELO|nr:uncharacterized protein PAC_03558 [Phialocephala subalpina]
MPSDTAITELLYAILKQKCLKDIDWNKVASDPILHEPITNGHAARMRYSRFKKQMDGTASIRRPRNPASSSSTPRRSRVEKNESPKKIKKNSSSHSHSHSQIKSEHAGDESREGTVDSSYGVEMGMSGEMVRVKKERESKSRLQSQAQNEAESPYNQDHISSNGMLLTPLPSTPTYTPRYCIERSPSPSPNSHPSHQNQESFTSQSLDEYVTSFGIDNQVGHGVSEGLFGEVVGHGGIYDHGMGMSPGLGMGMEGSFESLWDPNSSMSQSQSQGQSQSQSQGGRGGVLVKIEPTWEEAYNHV